ncbi:MAG: hypothetical protein ACLP50_08305 [Solirubrobacteraceae bacterium]
MSALTTAAAAGVARETAHTDRELLTPIARGGLLISETELRYQLQRRAMDLGALPGLLADLQQRGLIESETHYRLTLAGAALVAVGDRPAPRGISSIPWANQPLPTSCRPSRRRAASTAPTRASQAKAVRGGRKTARLMT